ncbi:phage tail protein [Escherichia coli]|nr:phage tail protein [Escherichia coli]
MTVKYHAILTNQGAARLANATMLGSKLNLTRMAVGDANGVLPTPDPAQTKLINQKRIAPLNLLGVDPNNQSQIIAEQIIPENEGGFWIREIGLFDDEGVLIAVANCPETYKPQLQEGSGRTQTIRMILVVTNTEAITLKIDPSVVLATRKYVDDEVLELKLYVDDQMKKLHSAVTGALAGKQPLDSTLTDLSGKDVAGILQYLGLGEGSALPVGVPVPWPSATPPTGWLKCNGAAFSAEEYPELAKAYPTNKLPDLRGEFIRGWDDGRGVDSGRTLLTNQEHAVISHNHGIPTKVGSVTNIPYGIEQVISDETIFSSAKTVGVDYWANSERVFTYTTGGRNGAESVSSPDASSLIKETRPRNLAFAYIVRAA